MHPGIRIIAAAVAATSLAASAQSAPLTLAEAQRRAVER